jgi:hypothetical protein
VEVQGNQNVSVKVNGSHQFLTYTHACNVNLLGESINAIGKNTEAVLEAGEGLI